MWFAASLHRPIARVEAVLVDWSEAVEPSGEANLVGLLKRMLGRVSLVARMGGDSRGSVEEQDAAPVHHVEGEDVGRGHFSISFEDAAGNVVAEMGLEIQEPLFEFFLELGALG